MSWTTTLNEIEKHGPCVDDWKTLLSFLNKTEADDAPLELLTILEVCGAEFAIWSLRAIEGHEREKALFAKEIRKTLNAYAYDYAVYAAYVAERAALAADYAADYAVRVAAEAAYDAALAAGYDADYAAQVAQVAANAERAAQGELLKKMLAGEL